jgi:hypothetical protein
MWNLLNADAASDFPMGNFFFNGDFTTDSAANSLLDFLARHAGQRNYRRPRLRTRG